MLSVLSDSKNSELRRAIGMNGTRLNSIFPLVSEKIEPSVFISHFDFKINWSNAQNESNWRFLSVNSMRNGRISQLKAPTIEYCEKALALFLFWSVYVLIVENQKITSDLNIRNGYYPFKRRRGEKVPPGFSKSPPTLKKSPPTSSAWGFWLFLKN